MTTTMTLRKSAALFAGLLLAFAIAGHFVMNTEVALGAPLPPPTSALDKARAAVKTCQTDKDPLACLSKLEGGDSVCASDNPECLQIIQNAIVKAGGAPKFTKTPPPEKSTASCGMSGLDYLNVINWMTCGWFIGSWTINAIIALFVAMGAWLAQLALGLSAHAFELPVVQRGFTVSLAFANLGFVLGIIVIAIATILRIESYGMKQILWKLVVMAILVNFSMVIAGQIVGFSNTAADYFMDRTAPSTGLGNAVAGTSGSTSYLGFVDKITGAFAPQNFFRPPDEMRGDLGLSALFTMMFSTIFSAFFLAMIAFAFFAIAILFLIRFFYISMLLILMPLAWMMWVFPLFKSNWDKWWHNFLKWCFFAPICVFFLYLAVLSGEKPDDSTAFSRGSKAFLDAYVLNVGGIANPVDKNKGDVAMALANLTNQQTGFFGSVAQGVLVLILAYGGLFVANSLSITGAHAAMGAVKAGGKAAAGWGKNVAGGKAARFATARPEDRRPLPENAGRLARFQRWIGTTKPVEGLQRAVQKVTRGDTAQRLGVTQDLEKYGKKTDFGAVRDLRLRAKAANSEARELEPIARHEREANMMRVQSNALGKVKVLREKAAEKEQAATAPNARPSEVPGLQKEAAEARLEAETIVKNGGEEMRTFDREGRWDEGIKAFGDRADAATAQAVAEAGRVSDSGRQKAFTDLVRGGKAAARMEELRKNARGAYDTANEMAKKNPRLASRVFSAVGQEVGVFEKPHGVKVDKATQEAIAHFFGMGHAEGEEHAKPSGGEGSAKPHAGGAPAEGGGTHAHA